MLEQGFFSYDQGKLKCEEISLEAIALEVGTPTYIYSAQAFRTSYQELKKGLSGLNPLICFAVKSNSNIHVLDLLAREGAGMDVVSSGEFFRTMKANVPFEKTVFSGVGKKSEEIFQALGCGSHGIFSFNVESTEELMRIHAIGIEMGRKARIALRFNPDVNPKTHPYISTGLRKNKFGMNRAEILKILAEISTLKGIQLKGISIHIGSQLMSLAPLEEAFEAVKALLHEIQPLLKEPLEFIDLGGGPGITYDQEESPQISEYCAIIRKHFGGTPLKILIEPGRVLSGNAGVLLTQVLYRKQRPKKDFLIVDAAMNDLIRPALYDGFHQIIPINEEFKSLNLRKTTVVGPVCESADVLGDHRELSTHLGGGDLLAILSAGAYGFSMASNYNSRPRGAEVLVENGSWSIIRRRETLEQLIENEV